MNNIDILVENIDLPFGISRSEAFIVRVLELLDVDNWEFSVTFCDNDFIRNLNREYRDKDNATDVLTFAQDDDPLPFETNAAVHNAGDIIISLHALGENVEYFDVEEDEELKRLIIHGILHLKGMDHSDNSPNQEMLIFQEKLLEELTEVKIF